MNNLNIAHRAALSSGIDHHRVHPSFSRLRYLRCHRIPAASAQFRIDRGTYNTEESREDRRRFNQPCVHEGITICWRARVVWRRKDRRDGEEGPRTGLSYECEFLSRAAWLRGWKQKKKKREKKNGASRGARRRRAFVVTRIHQSFARREYISNGTRASKAWDENEEKSN